jgi:hypothetical protein
MSHNPPAGATPEQVEAVAEGLRAHLRPAIEADLRAALEAAVRPFIFRGAESLAGPAFYTGSEIQLAFRKAEAEAEAVLGRRERKPVYVSLGSSGEGDCALFLKGAYLEAIVILRPGPRITTIVERR